jgi:predicted RNA-binding Zn ribbon-like protein
MRDEEPITDRAGRTQAPGALALVQAFVNTDDFETGQETLTDPVLLVAWFAERHLIEGAAAVTGADLRQAIEVREAIRELLVGNAGGEVPPNALATLNRASDAARFTVVFGDDRRASLDPNSGGVDGALGRLLAIVYAAMVDGSWIRLKVCRDDTCRWAFYDTSKNRSGTWCSMAICGNRAKTRAYRTRRAQSSS